MKSRKAIHFNWETNDKLYPIPTFDFLCWLPGKVTRIDDPKFMEIKTSTRSEVKILAAINGRKGFNEKKNMTMPGPAEFFFQEG